MMAKPTTRKTTTVSDEQRNTRGTGRVRMARPLLASTLLASLVLAGCASDAELDTMKPESDVARSIWNLAWPVFLIGGAVLVAVCGALLFLAWKNRVAGYEGDDEFPEQISHNNTLEIGWTIAPAVIMAIIAVFTITTHIAINDTEANALTIEVEGESVEWEPTIVVVGQQWWWEYRYYLDGDQITAEVLEDPLNLPPADIVTSGQFAIPTGQEVELIITSRDVIHSHWIPRLNGKRDAVPGRFSPWIIEADDPGIYFGQCTEFCGLSHSRMRMQTIALSPDDFQTWINDQMSPAEFDGDLAEYVTAYRGEGTPVVADDASAELRGLDVFANQCASCHLVNGFNDLDYDGAEVVSGSAPDLTHLTNRTTFAGGILNMYNEDGSLNVDDLSEWIRDPDAVKDNFADNLADGELPRGMPDRNLTERQIDDVVAFLSTLGDRPTDEMIAATEVE